MQRTAVSTSEGGHAYGYIFRLDPDLQTEMTAP